MNSKNYKTYILSFFVSAISTIFAIGFFNFVIDPYGFYRIVDIRGFNQQKEGVRNKIRYVKALEIPLRKPKTIIIGSSRVHDGMNPEHILFKNIGYQSVYNLGIDMARIHELLQYVKHATINSNIEHVIFGVDFFMFNASQKKNPSFDSKLVGREIKLSDYLMTAIFSVDAFFDSVQTVKNSFITPNREEFLANGFRPGNMVFYGLKDYVGLHYYTNYIFTSSLPSDEKYYSDIKIDEQVFDDFEEILQICRAKNIDIKIYISPAHANLDGEAVRAAGAFEMMELWKKKLVDLTDKYKVDVWDFSGYNSITTEEVKTPMTYYWDSSHFTEKVSDIILKRIFNSTESLPKDFGIKLSNRNIEKHLDDIKNERNIYYKLHQRELEELHLDYQHSLSGGQMNLKKIEGIF